MSRSVIDILEELEATPGKLAKIDIMEAARKNELLKRVFIAALDPYVVYYVNKFKVGKPGVPSHEISDDEFLEDFLDMLRDQLATRKVTGNAAKELVESRFRSMPDVTLQKWCQRILLKNMRCGVQDSVNKVWPGLFKSFEVALAKTLNSEFTRGEGIKILDKVNYPVRVEPKLDGLRCIAIKKDGKVTLFTRNGTIIDSPGVSHIKKVLEDANFDNVVLDGEMMSNGTWNDTVTAMMKGRSR